MITAISWHAPGRALSVIVRGQWEWNHWKPSTPRPADLYFMTRNSHVVKAFGGPKTQSEWGNRPNDCELRWAGKPRWCAHGNDASKPLHVGLLVPLAFAVGTDAENKQNQMMACGMVCRTAYSQNPQMPVVDSFTFVQFCSHVWYQKVHFAASFGFRRYFPCTASVVLEEEVSFSMLGIAFGIQTLHLHHINIKLTYLSSETVDYMYVACTKGRKITVENI